MCSCLSRFNLIFKGSFIQFKTGTLYKSPFPYIFFFMLHNVLPVLAVFITDNTINVPTSKSIEKSILSDENI